jgi:hypothetical protein
MTNTMRRLFHGWFLFASVLCICSTYCAADERSNGDIEGGITIVEGEISKNTTWTGEISVNSTQSPNAIEKQDNYAKEKN